MNRFNRKPGSLRRCLISEGQDYINIASVHFVQPINVPMDRLPQESHYHGASPQFQSTDPNHQVIISSIPVPKIQMVREPKN